MSLDPATVIAQNLQHMLDPSRRYPQPLPDELAPWYCYARDGGHSILVLLEQLPTKMIPSVTWCLRRSNRCWGPAGA